MKQYAVIGIGRFGQSVVETLIKKGQQVLAADIREEPLKEVEEIATQTVVLNSTDERALKAVGIQDMDVVIVAIGRDMEASILTTLILKEIGIKEIVAKAVSRMHGKVLQRIGASRVVYPEGDMGERVANSLLYPNILDRIFLSDNYGIFEVAVPDSFIGKTISELQIRTAFGLNVIAIKKNRVSPKKEKLMTEESINISPLPDDRLETGDVLVCLGLKKDMERFQKHLTG